MGMGQNKSTQEAAVILSFTCEKCPLCLKGAGKPKTFNWDRNVVEGPVARFF